MILNFILKKEIRKLLIKKNGKPIISNFTSTTENITTTDLEGYREAWQAWIRSVGGGAEYVGQIVGPQGDASELYPIKWDTLQEKEGAEIR